MLDIRGIETKKKIMRRKKTRNNCRIAKTGKNKEDLRTTKEGITEGL